MNFSSPKWYPIAVGLTVINAGAALFAAMRPEAMHAGGHIFLGALCAIWAQRLRQRRDLAPGDPDVSARLEALEGEVGGLQRQLGETAERLDFTERLLVQERERRDAQLRPDAPRDGGAGPNAGP